MNYRIEAWGSILVVGLGCSKTPPPSPSAASSAAVIQPATTAQTGSAQAADPPAATSVSKPAAATAPDSAEPPASFKGGNKENIASAVGLGCEATSQSGWLEFLCRKKNGTGGHPTRAVIQLTSAERQAAPPADANADTSADAGNVAEGKQVLPDEHGELRVVIPFNGDEKRDVTLEWSDTRYELHIAGTSGTLEWGAAGLPLRRACARVQDETKAKLAAAQKLEGAAKVSAAEVAKLPRFGVCQPAGLGSWALGLRNLEASGEGGARRLHIVLDAIRVHELGEVKNAAFGTFDVSPGGLALGTLQVYDYDDDGRDELIVPYELKDSAPSTPLPPPIWSFSDSGVAAYAKAPLVSGGVSVEHIDYDMRPDLGGYGPFVAWFGADCGQKACRPRLTGPRFFAHALPDGGFSTNDDAARAALKRACPSKVASVVASAGAQANAEQTAKNLVCARALGMQNDVILNELNSKRAAFCGEAATCPLLTTLTAWLELPLPVSVGSAAK